MFKVAIIEQEENVNIATFEVDYDFLGPFSKIMILKSQEVTGREAIPGKLLPYSPLAQTLFQKFGAAGRIDFISSNENTLISIADRLEWNTNRKAVALEILNNFFNGNIAPISIKALERDFMEQAKKPVDFSNNPIKSRIAATFARVVNPILARDGGAMELLGIDIKPDGQITADVALMGSCSSCQSSTTQTLNEATQQIQQLITVIKDEFGSQNPRLRILDFVGITEGQIPAPIFTKA